jgi:hypothetical protein
VTALGITTAQDRAFVDKVIPDLLDRAIDWISKNMPPEDVFSLEDLDDWAIGCGYVKREKKRGVTR